TGERHRASYRARGTESRGGLSQPSSGEVRPTPAIVPSTPQRLRVHRTGGGPPLGEVSATHCSVARSSDRQPVGQLDQEDVLRLGPEERARAQLVVERGSGTAESALFILGARLRPHLA